MFVVVHIDRAHPKEPGYHRRMEGTLRNGHVYLLVLQEAPQLTHSDGVPVEFCETSGPVVLANYRVCNPVKLEEVNSIGKRPCGDNDLVNPPEIIDHPGEQIDMRGIRDFKPDLHRALANSSDEAARSGPASHANCGDGEFSVGP